MQRIDHLKHTELLDSIKKAKTDIFEALLMAFQEGHQDEKKYPYDIAKGRIFTDFWQYLDSLPPVQFLQPYSELEALVSLPQFIKSHLSEKMDKRDISENKKNVLKEMMRFFYDLQRSQVLLCSQQHYFAAFEMQDEAVNLSKQCNKYQKQLTEYEEGLNEYASSGLIKLMDLHVGVSYLLSVLHLPVPQTLAQHTARKKIPSGFERLHAFLNKFHDGTVQAGLEQYQAESGQPREGAYRRELQIFIQSLNNEREALSAVINRLHVKYAQIRQQLLLLSNKLQQISDREIKIQECLDLMARVDVSLVSATTMTAACDEQTAVPKLAGAVLASASLNYVKVSPWNQASQKINQAVKDIREKLSAYINSFSEEFVSTALESMARDKKLVVDQLQLLQLVDETLVLWGDSVRQMRAEAGRLSGQIQPPKSCCFLFGLFSGSPSHDKAQQSLLGDNLLDLKIRDDQYNDIADMSRQIEEDADNEEVIEWRKPSKSTSSVNAPAQLRPAVYEKYGKR